MKKPVPPQESTEDQVDSELLSDDEVAGEAEPELSAAEQEEHRKQMMARLDAFGESLAKTRSEAISARQSSGIEDEWLEDEEFYQGIDDANRSEFKNTWRTKPTASGTSTSSSPKSTRSTVFPNITRPYCDMAAARIADMLMPVDDRPFSVDNTPIPDLIELSEGRAPKSIIDNGKRLFPGMQDQQDQYVQGFVQNNSENAKRLLTDAKTKAELAQTRIDDWLTECRYQAENRRVIEDAARVGVGILKGPFPELKRITVYKDGGLFVEEKLVPVSKRIDYWNFYPDGACGESIHNGSQTWERDFITKRQLRALIGNEDYIEDQIQLCLAEGPQKAEAVFKPTPDQTDSEKKGQFEIWYYHGTAERDDLIAAGVKLGDDDIDPHMHAMVVMVNNRVIKAALNPLDTGDFPYDVMVWQRRTAHWAGIGVARQIRTPQRIVTAGTRNLMDNAGLAAGPMLVFLDSVESADGILGLGPRKVFRVAESADNITDARYAVGTIKVDMLVNELMEIINLGLRLAEDVTGMPMIMQGQMGKAPDTLGGMEMLFNAASSVLRRLARLYDDLITEPHIHRYYNWLLQHGEDEEKGDYCIKARGSSALVERSIQSQELTVIIQLAGNPVHGIDPKKAAEQYLKSRHFNPDDFKFDDEQWEQIVTNLAQPQQQDTSVEVATIRADSAREIQAMKNESAQQSDAMERELQLVLKQMDGEIESISQGGQSADNMAKIKADLAKVVMQLNTQKQLANQKPVKQVARPGTEVPGRARPGQAFQR